jgi:hypothetical protein
MQTTTTVTTTGRVPRWIVLGLLLLGLLLLAGGTYAAWREIAFRRVAVETDGRVVEMLRSTGSRDRDGRTSVTYRPVFTFALPDGKLVRVEASVSSDPPCCRVGDRVRVRYDPARPERAAMTGFVESWLVTTILGGMGAVFGGIGLVLLRVTGGRRAAASTEAQGMNAMTFAVPLAGLRREAGPDGPRWVIQARWADPRSGVTRLFESEPLAFDPVPQMRDMTMVQVRFDPGRPDTPYWMDLSFLRATDDDATVVMRRG